MTDVASAMIAAQEAALRASATLATAMGGTARIYTSVPTNAPFPYIILGDDQVLGDDDECTEANEIFSTVNVWSKPGTPSVAEIRVIAGLVKSILAAKLTPATHEVVDYRHVETRFLTDPDFSSHAVILIHYWLTPSEVPG